MTNYILNDHHHLTPEEKQWFVDKYTGYEHGPERKLEVEFNETLPFSVTKKLVSVGKLMGLTLADTTIFIGKAGKFVEPHIDVFDYNGGRYPLPWRLSYFVQGGCPFHWWSPSPVVQENPYAEVVARSEIIQTLDTRNTESAFIKTNVPHSVDMTYSKELRIVLSATYYFKKELTRPNWDDIVLP